MEKNIKIFTVKEILQEAKQEQLGASIPDQIASFNSFDSALISTQTFMAYIGTLCVNEQFVKDVRNAIELLAIKNDRRVIMVKVGGFGGFGG